MRTPFWPPTRFVFTDELAPVGMYVEPLGFSREAEAGMAAQVPAYTTF